MTRVLGPIARAVLDRFGYVLWKREFLRYGISPFLDITRLNRAAGLAVQTFFDVGANIGQTAIEALRVFPEARVFAFEPHPDSFARVRQASLLARFSAHQLAFSDRDGEVTLYEYGTVGDGSLMNSLVPDARFSVQFRHTARERTVECATVDAFCGAHAINRIDVLKIDAEGCDLLVLKGASRMLREGRIGFVYTEFNDLQPKEGTTGGSLLPISEYLASFDFRYVATYTDFVLPGADMFVCANALFIHPSTN